MNHLEDISVEEMFDIVAQFLYNGSLQEVRKEFYLKLFAEWSQLNLDIIMEAVNAAKNKKSKN